MLQYIYIRKYIRISFTFTRPKTESDLKKIMVLDFGIFFDLHVTHVNANTYINKYNTHAFYTSI